MMGTELIWKTYAIVVMEMMKIVISKLIQLPLLLTITTRIRMLFVLRRIVL